ncbi:MAG: SDR family NAD(P)-dependent oxidoreductase, partial [Coriobacteriia bacterium]|nr:SDR family NAD(P)-dependent oxidoreductase [Coriobacteriia bacterium]
MPSMLITGVTTGIGNALARKVAAEDGWTVIGTARGEGDPASYGLPRKVVVLPLELSDPASVDALVARVLSEHGAPDVLVNNAGFVLYGPVEEESPAKIESLFRVNVLSAVTLIQGLLPAMRERGSGTIVTITSLGGRLVFPFFTSYNATKHALEGYSEGLWHELRPFGIRVKAIEP